MTLFSESDSVSNYLFIFLILFFQYCFKVQKSMLRCDDQSCKFDYEKESLVSVKVKVTDSGSPPLTFVETLTLEVIDENDPPQDLRLVGESVVENSPPGTIIGAHLLNQS